MADARGLLRECIAELEKLVGTKKPDRLELKVSETGSVSVYGLSATETDCVRPCSVSSIYGTAVQVQAVLRPVFGPFLFGLLC